MKDELDAGTLYQQSIDFEKSKKLRHGEADNSNVALWAQGEGEGGNGSKVEPNLRVCRFWKSGICKRDAKCRYHHPNGKASRKKRSRDDCNDSRDEDPEREELAQLKKKLKNQEEQHEAHLAYVASLLVTKGIKPGDVGCGGYGSE